MTRAQRVYDVAIVGFGPAGAVAAGAARPGGPARLRVRPLARGLRQAARDRARPRDHARVPAARRGRRRSTPHVEPFTPSEYFGVDGQLIRRMTMVAPPYPQGYTPSMVFTQPPVERALRARVAQLPNVEVALGRRDDARWRRTPTASRCTLRDAGRRAHACARATSIGCDGASSTVRDAGRHRRSTTWTSTNPGWWSTCCVNERGLAKLPKTSVQYCEPRAAVHAGDRARSNHRRWEISLQAAAKTRSRPPTPEGTWTLLSRWLTPDDGELWRQASYRFHALVAQRMARRPRVHRRRRRAPAAAVPRPGHVPGRARRRQPGLEARRRAARRRARCRGAKRCSTATASSAQAHVRELTSRIKGIGARDLRARRGARRARATPRLLAECGGVVKDTPRQDILPALDGGCLSARATPGARHAVSAAVAARGGDTRMRMDDARRPRLAPGAATTRCAHAAPRRRRHHAAATSARAALRETEGVVAAWMRRHRCHAALVRPDHYVFGVAADAR